MTLTTVEKETSLESEHFEATVQLWRSDRFGGTFKIRMKYYKKLTLLFGLLPYRRKVEENSYQTGYSTITKRIRDAERAREHFDKAVDQASRRLDELEDERGVLQE